MNYTPIKAICIKNFRCLEQLILSFEHSPIIALQAGNDSGKSSAVKAIQAIIYNDERDVKNYIRTGTKGFEVDVILADNTRIQRIKTASGNTYTLYNPDGTVRETWSKISQDVPETIRAIFGVKIEDATGELLNLRTCESLLLFSLTKTTDNYKMVHACISDKLIETAYIVGNGRIKELSSTIDKSTILRDDLYAQAARIITLEDKTLEKLQNDRTQIQNLSKVEQGLFDCCSTKVEIDELQSRISQTDQKKLSALIEMKITDEEMQILSEISGILQAKANITLKRAELNTEKIENLAKEMIDSSEIDKLQALDELVRLKAIIAQKQAVLPNTSKFDALAELQVELDELMQQFTLLDDIRITQIKYRNCKSLHGNIQMQLEALKETLKGSVSIRYDKENNALIKSCDHCGEEVVFDLKDLELIEA